MMSPRICKNLVGGLAAALFLLTANAARAGLGISPSQMITPNLSKGATVERTFVLSRSEPTEDLFFTVTTEGATKDWTTLDKGTTFTMPKGEQRFPIVVTAKIPLDAANGEYKGGIRMVSSADPAKVTNGSVASTLLAALIQTDFTVTGEQVLEYELTDIAIKNSEAGSPLDVSVTVGNTGNVAARPTKVHVEVYDKLNVTQLESTDVTEMGSVAAFTVGDIAIAVPTKLKMDQYWARVSVYKDDALLKAENLVFEIVEVGSLQKTGDLKEIKLNKKAEIGEIIKITGVFKNTSKSNYSAKMVTETYRDGRLVKLIESESTTIMEGKTEDLVAYFAPEAIGDYAVKAHVVYGGGKTPVQEATISVEAVGQAGMSRTAIVAIICFVVVLLAAIITLVIVLKKRKNTHIS